MGQVVAKGVSSTARKAEESRLRSLRRFVAVARLEHEDPAMQLRAYVAAMVLPTGALTRQERAKFVVRAPGERGRGRAGQLSLTTAGAYLATLGRVMGVPAAEVAGIRRGLASLRLTRRETTTRAAPLSAEVAGKVLAELRTRRVEEPQVLAAATLAWVAALRMADLRSLRARDVTVVSEVWLRVTWWQTKDVKVKGVEVPLTYRLSERDIRFLARWLRRVGRGPLFSMDCTRRLLEVTRRHCPLATGHSWRRGALQDLARRGGTWGQLAALARHSNVEVTRLYLLGGDSPDTLLAEQGSRLISAAMRQ